MTTSTPHQPPQTSVFLSPANRSLTPLPESDSGGKRRRQANAKQIKALLETQMVIRFLEEVHLCEKEGRVLDRPTLEKDLLLSVGAISEMRAGRRGVLAVNILRFKQKYNADWRYILIGVRDPEHSGVRMGSKMLDRYPGYQYPYKTEGIDLLANLTSDGGSENS